MPVSLPYRIEKGAVLLHVRLTPKGGRDGFDGVSTGADGKTVLLARVRAIPEDGAANAALVALLAKQLGLRKSAIELVSGAASRQKMLKLNGNPDVLAAALASLMSP